MILIGTILTFLAVLATWVGLWITKKSEREKKQRAELMEAEKKGYDKADKERVDLAITELKEIQGKSANRIDDMEKTIIRMEGKIDTVINLVESLGESFKSHKENHENQRRRADD